MDEDCLHENSESQEKALINLRGLVKSCSGNLRGQVGVQEAKRQEGHGQEERPVLLDAAIITSNESDV